MKKIPCIFVRDFETRPCVITQEITPGCEWVLNKEGRPTRKWDGTAALIRDGILYARYDCKKGRTAPKGFEPCQPEPDLATGHWPGWIAVNGQPQYGWHAETFKSLEEELRDGTYELCGPKINGNPEKLDAHVFISHGSGEIPALEDRSFDGIRTYLEANMIEGLVFHRENGEMAKIRRGDFGFGWGKAQRG